MIYLILCVWDWISAWSCNKKGIRVGLHFVLSFGKQKTFQKNKRRFWNLFTYFASPEPASQTSHSGDELLACKPFALTRLTYFTSAKRPTCTTFSEEKNNNKEALLAEKRVLICSICKLELHKQITLCFPFVSSQVPPTLHPQIAQTLINNKLLIQKNPWCWSQSFSPI